MERGVATRDKVAIAMAGAEAIEIKATIPNRQIGVALARFKLTPSDDEERLIYFFDTPKLDLLGAGIIARARRVVGDTHDSTVILKGHIKRVARGEKPISAIFTRAQEKFLTSIAGHKIDFTSLVVLGPLIAQRWRFEDPGCPWPITAELWTRGDRKRMMELSIKAPAAQAAVAVGGFMAFLAEVGAERDKQQQTKTRWALDYYIKKLARPGARIAKTVKTSAPKIVRRRSRDESVYRHQAAQP